MEYLILDEDHSSLTRAVLRTPPTATVLEFEIPENDVPLLEGHRDLQFIGVDEHAPSFAGTVTRRRGNRMAVEKGAELGEDSFENLQVPFYHDGYAYPISGAWKGRCAIQTKTLSCGGISFESASPLAVQEVVEVTVHTRDGALLIPTKILRQQEGTGLNSLFFGRFMSGVDDAERFVRKEVLFLQLKQRDARTETTARRELLRFS